MNAQPVLLLFRSNLSRYELTVYDGNTPVRVQIFNGQGRLCLRPRSPCIRIVASPRVGGHTTTLYFWIDITCKRSAALYFSFPADRAPTPPAAVNTFTLTDRNYGLSIDGSLLFTQG